MAMPVRSLESAETVESSDRVATRSHGDPRRTPSRQTPDLSVVPRRRRWPAFVIGITGVVVLGSMFGAAIFHTQLADRQLQIDRLDSQVDDARARFDELRNERAVLRSPARIAGEAERLGMVPGETSRFVEIDAVALARQLAAAGPTDDARIVLEGEVEPLDQVRDVKAVTAGDP